jgi:ATP-dependent DNA helicase RecQ
MQPMPASRRETLLPATATRDQQKVTWTRLRRAALAHFGVGSFRAGQMDLIEAVFHGRDAFGALPTGAGKSLCFQLPALFLPKPTIVVSPLLALMRDQERRLVGAQVPVTKIDSTLTASESRAAHEEIARGGSRLIYVTPEHLENPLHSETFAPKAPRSS